MEVSISEKLGYTTGEAAALLSCSEKTVRRLIKEGRLHAIRIGERRLLVPRSAIIKMLSGITN